MVERTAILIATLAKHPTSEIRVSLDDHHGEAVVDLRTYAAFTAARVPMPTKRGLAIPVDQLPALIAALRAAQAEAAARGLMSPNTEARASA